MTRSRLGSNIGCLVVAVLFLALVGVVVGCMSEPSEKPNILHSPTPIVTATMRPTRTNEPTTTPAPNYHGTQVSLDNAIATHQAGIDEQMRKATGTAEALAIEHQATVYSVDVSRAQTRLSGAIEANEYEQLLHSIVISKTVVMAQDEINFAAWRQRAGNNIWLTWNIGALVAAGTLALLACFAVVKHYMAADKPPLSPPITTTVVTVSEDHKSQKFAELPTNLPGFHTWAACVVKGTTLGHRYWAVDETTKQFTDPEYRGLCETMRASGWVRYNDPDVPSQGQYLTESGKRVLLAWLGEMER